MCKPKKHFKWLERSTTLLLFLFLAFLLQTSEVYATKHLNAQENASKQEEEVRITGTVVDESQAPIIGASIVVEGTTKGATSDINGYFELNAPKNSVLIVSFLGYIPEKITVSGKLTSISVELEANFKELDEIVVVGYGTQSKATVTGSLSTINSEEISEQPVSNISQALAGRLPGLIANQAGGRPGKDGSTIKIRGIATLDAGAGSNPLIMIDGIERDQGDLNFLDPNEIESLSILKDASATAVYGVRGANGVILVTTKRGEVGPTKMKYKASTAIIIPSFRLDFIDSYEQSGLLNEYSGFAENSTDPLAPYPQSTRERFKGVIDGKPLHPTDPFFYPSTDYSDLMIKDYASQQQHNFTISGGTERLRYFTSLGFFDQGGLFKELNPGLDKSTNYKRYNYRANIDLDLTESTSAKINIGGSFNQNTSLGMANSEPARSFYWSSQQHSAPWDGYLYEGKLIMLEDNANSVLLNNDMRGYNVQLENTADYSFIVNQKLDYITPGLSVKGKVSLVSYFSNYIRRDKDSKRLPFWEPVINDDSTAVNLYQAKEDVRPSNTVSQGKNRKEYYEFSINYKRTFAEHHTFSALALANAEKTHFKLNYLSDIPRSYMGIVGRLTYNYKNRYLLEYNLGYNGSENFAEGKRFGKFPAYSAGWSFTEEPWLQSVIGNEILNYGKIRYSYGIVGNDKLRIGGQDQRFLYLPDSYTLYQVSDDGWLNYPILWGEPGETQRYRFALPGIVGNPDLTWEKSKKINYGVDLAFFSSLVTLKLDYFTENRTHILIKQNVIPVYQQAGDRFLNLGIVNNEGYEIEIGINKAINHKSRVYFEANYTHSRNKIIEIDEPNKPYEYQQNTNRRVGELWGYQQDGFFESDNAAKAYKEKLWERYQELNPSANEADYQAYQVFTTGYDVSAGDILIIDRNNDGVINSEDQGYLNMTKFPETMFGFKLGAIYNNWSISAMFQGASNFSINGKTSTSPNLEKGSIIDFVMNRYTPERYAAGETVEFPRLLATNNNWELPGTFWYQDATYLRLKNVEIAYTFDSTVRLLDNLGIDNIRVFANGMNLLTFSAIKYIDPETTDGKLRYPRSKVINLGLQVQF